MASLIGRGTDAESAALRTALSGLSDESFSRLRVSSSVPGRRGPHVSATELIECVMQTGQANASRTWAAMKKYENFNMSIRHVETYRFPGQRGGRESEVVDIPAALRIIMMLPGKTAARVRVKASYLLTRFLAGDVTLVAEIYGMNELQNFLREHEPTHPLCAFRDAVDAGQTTTGPSTTDPETEALESQAKRARLMRQIAEDEEAVMSSNERKALSQERAAKAKDIVSAEVAERGMELFAKFQTMTGGLDDRERIALRARITTSLLGVEQPQPARCEVIMEDFIRSRRSNVSPSVLGRKAAEVWRSLNPGQVQPTKRVVLGNGQATDVKIYYEDEIDTVLIPALERCTIAPTTAPPVMTLDHMFRSSA